MQSIEYNRILKVRYAIVITLLLGIAIMLSPFKVIASGGTYARPTLTLSFNVGDKQKLWQLKKDINSSVGFDFIITSKTDNNGGCISLNMSTYNSLVQEQKTKTMESALTCVKNSDLSTMSRNKIYNFIESQDESTSSLVRQLSNDVNADFADAYVMFKPFSGALGTTLGVFAIAIFVTLTLMVVFDLSYITIPLIRDLLTPSSSEGKPKFVSNEAWYAVKEVDSEGGRNKDVLLVYLKKKTMQFVALSICILYLLSGKIYILIGNLMDMFRGILG